ncbi:PH domain-containing protein [Clostridium omnivorum]|uniref:Membrane protein n=1 Tax=Clostridium omnivorum TaxID=1604902 RepID=A0ABQ5NAG7_9CLOT|nr:PH domain-containing protein [Clostridium sp. E14]GLC32263.1 membrane protein [Clostridium sp. E14]
MNKFKALKGTGGYYVLASMIIYDALIVVLLMLINSYIITMLLKLLLAGCTLYHIYYILLSINLYYSMDENKFYINGAYGLRKINFLLNEIDGYSISEGTIKGLRLSGFGRSSFAYGEFLINKIGTTRMYVTANKEILYLKVRDMNYAVSPENLQQILSFLNSRGINQLEWETKRNKDLHLYKEKRYSIPFFITSLVTLVITLNPFILYLTNKLPSKMPLNFDAAFIPVEFGTGKQFAVNQAIYGFLNMAILFCMYYASFFYARYDKKSGNKFIYGALAIAIVFLIIQLRVLYTFR